MNALVSKVNDLIQRLSGEEEMPVSTFLDQAESAVRDFHNRADPDPDACENYTIMFIADYARAVNWRYTCPDAFLGAYAHRALAVINGASEQELDDAAYRIRQDWTERTRARQ